MIDEMRHFLLIQKYGTFTEAAKRAHLSQPALSASVQRLEEQMGAKLFERGRNGAQLNSAGQAFAPYVISALAAVSEGKRAIKELTGLSSGEVHIASGATASSYLLPKVLTRFRRKYPGVKLFLKEGYALDIEAEVLSGKVDLGIVSGKGDDFWMKDELILVASPKINARKAGFLTFPEGSTTRELLQENFGNVEIVMELAGIASVKANVRAGMGKALLSKAAVASDIKAGRMVEVPSRKTPVRRSLSLIHRGEALLPPAALALRAAILKSA